MLIKRVTLRIKSFLLRPFQAINNFLILRIRNFLTWITITLPKKIYQGVKQIFTNMYGMLFFFTHPKSFIKTRFEALLNKMLENKEFANRVFSSCVLIAISLPLIIIGGWPLQILVFIVTVIAAWEWGGLAPGGFLNKRIMLTVSIGIALLSMRFLGPAAPALTSIYIFIDTFFPRPHIQQRFHNQVGFAYLFVAALSFTWIHDNFGALATIWLVLTVIITDMTAYFGGKLFKGVKLIPAISPGKTVSGAICALVAASFIGLLYALITGKPLLFFILLSMLTSAMAQAGDLLESILKRRVEAKDSGNLIPGHGGILDRIDGFLLASPTAFLVLKITELLS